MSCINKYNDLLQNISSIEDLKDLIVACSTIEYDKYTYDNIDICSRVIKKLGSQFYNKRYNRYWVHELIGESANIFDLNIIDNCCNCVAIVLYYDTNIDTIKLNKLFKYLYSMKKSLDNVSSILPDFIIRFYLDKSVLRYHLENFKQNKIFFHNFVLTSIAVLSFILSLGLATILINIKNIYQSFLNLNQSDKRFLYFLVVFFLSIHNFPNIF
jgi:hypothetical protein